MLNYGALKNKVKNRIREGSYADVIFNMLTNMFIWDLDNIYNSREIEALLLTHGHCAIVKKDSNYILCYGSFGGDLDYNGIGKNFIATSLNGRYTKEFKNWKENKNIQVFFNNWTNTPDLNISRYSNLLAEIDKSLEIGVVNTRLTNMLGVTDENNKTKFEEALKLVQEGKPAIVASISNLLTEEINGQRIDITESDKVDKLQYLSMLHNEITTRLMNLYGINSNNTLKMAQQTADEFKVGEEFSKVLPNIRFDVREKMLDEANKKFGTEWTVEKNPLIDFNPLTNSENDNGVNDDTNNDNTTNDKGVNDNDTNDNKENDN